MSVSIEKERACYNSQLFPALWKAGLCNLATCSGKFPLEKVEFSPRQMIEVKQKTDFKQFGKKILEKKVVEKKFVEIMIRRDIYRTDEELIVMMARKNPDALQLGGIVPLLPGDRYGVKTTRQHDTYAKDNNYANPAGPLVIDIDAKDYDRTGVCECPASDVCQTCWSLFIETARRVMHYLFVEMYGLDKVFEVFSGRRGMHWWCYADRVLLWTNKQRAAFMDRYGKPQFDDDYLFEEILLPVFKSTPVLLQRDPKCSRGAVFEALYPKFDIAVTKTAAHLKGIPLTIHHSSGIVRIPLPNVKSRVKFDVRMAMTTYFPRQLTLLQLQELLNVILKKIK